MHDPEWLPLTDYSSKYRVSISTLRRRIKHGQIQYRFEDGKYLLHDETPRAFENSQIPASAPVNFARMMGAGAEVAPSEPMPIVSAMASPMEEPILSSASRLLSELKRAYMSILHEKEEQIIQLKEEVSDLKTLVRVLEEDNERMRAILKTPLRT